VKNYHRYTPKEISFIKRHVSGRSRADLANLFNVQHFGEPVTLSQLSNILCRLGLRNGLRGKNLPNLVPWNKGMKGWNPPGSEKGWFRPGHPGYRYKKMPVGSERITEDGYVQVKYSGRKGAQKNRWKAKHVLIWEKANGRVPKGHAVIFADGNTRNFDLSNLLLVSRAELAVMNRCKLISPRAEVTRTGKTLADLKMAVADRKRQAKQKTRTRRKNP